MDTTPPSMAGIGAELDRLTRRLTQSQPDAAPAPAGPPGPRAPSGPGAPAGGASAGTSTGLSGQRPRPTARRKIAPAAPGNRPSGRAKPPAEGVHPRAGGTGPGVVPRAAAAPRLHVGTSLAGTAAMEMLSLPPPPPAPSRTPPAGVPEEDWRDWAGLPEDLLEKVAKTLIAQTEAGWAAQVKKEGESEQYIQFWMEKRERDGNCLFVFARVCKEWRKAQLKVGGRLCTWVKSDVILPGRVELVKWALAEGCPRAERYSTLYTRATDAAEYGHHELVQWLCGEGGFAMDEYVMMHAAFSGNLELVQWLRGEGCPWDSWTCDQAVDYGHVQVLRWVRENGCPWSAYVRDRAAAKLGYTDDFGNLV